MKIVANIRSLLLHTLVPSIAVVAENAPRLVSPVGLTPPSPPPSFKGRADIEDALKKRVILGAAQRWRTARLRASWRRWRAGCEAVRAERALVRSRAARLGSVAAFLGGGSGSLRKMPRMDVARAFGTWVRVAEARKVRCRVFLRPFLLGVVVARSVALDTVLAVC